MENMKKTNDFLKKINKKREKLDLKVALRPSGVLLVCVTHGLPFRSVDTL